MSAQLILVDGIPGSGKSVLAQTIQRSTRQTNRPVRWRYEEEIAHPIFLFSDLATLQAVDDKLFSGRIGEVADAALDKWRRFAADLAAGSISVVADGTFFGYLTWMFHYLDRPNAETFAYVAGVQDALEAVGPHVVYLRQRDVTATIQNVLRVRGHTWAQRTISKAVDSPYGRTHGLDRIDGVEGLTRFWTDYQALEDRLFEGVRQPRLAVDVQAGDWASIETAVASWLDLPAAPAPRQPRDLSRFVGSYSAPDGTLVHVDLVDRSLRVRGLAQVWPNQRLIAVGDDAYEVLSLPFTLHFDDDEVSVEGPDLLGGRPPSRLVRLRP